MRVGADRSPLGHGPFRAAGTTDRNARLPDRLQHPSRCTPTRRCGTFPPICGVRRGRELPRHPSRDTGRTAVPRHDRRPTGSGSDATSSGSFTASCWRARPGRDSALGWLRRPASRVADFRTTTLRQRAGTCQASPLRSVRWTRSARTSTCAASQQAPGTVHITGAVFLQAWIPTQQWG